MSINPNIVQVVRNYYIGFQINFNVLQTADHLDTQLQRIKPAFVAQVINTLIMVIKLQLIYNNINN